MLRLIVSLIVNGSESDAIGGISGIGGRFFGRGFHILCGALHLGDRIHGLFLIKISTFREIFSAHGTTTKKYSVGKLPKISWPLSVLT